MLTRTTAILPEGLFASLGVARGDESMQTAKHVRAFFMYYSFLAYLTTVYRVSTLSCEELVKTSSMPPLDPLVVPSMTGRPVSEQQAHLQTRQRQSSRK